MPENCALDNTTGRWLCEFRISWEQPAANGTVTYYEVSYEETLDYCAPAPTDADADAGGESEGGSGVEAGADAACADAVRPGQTVRPVLEGCGGSICATMRGLRPMASYLLTVTAFNAIGSSSPSGASIIGVRVKATVALTVSLPQPQPHSQPQSTDRDLDPYPTS